MNLSRTVLLAVLCILAIGCKEKNPNFCDPDLEQCGPDAAIRCDDMNPCTVGACLNNVCVECTTASDDVCEAKQQVCGDDNLCRDCRVDNECSSGVCLGDHKCAPANNVIHAVPTGGATTTGCGALNNPCTLGQAFVEVDGLKNIIKLAAGTYVVSGPDGQDVTESVVLVARGATLNRMVGSGPILTVKNGGSLSLVGGILEGGAGATGDGIDCQSGGSLTVFEATLRNNNGRGIDVEGCPLNVSRSTISLNPGGGIQLDNTTFVIVGNVIYSNGTQQGTTGGVEISAADSPTNRLEFNSINSNLVQAGVGTGIDCIAGTLIAKNNLVYGNGSAANMIQVDGGCKHAYSTIGPTPVLANLDAMNNITTDPMFANLVTGDLHIAASSPARRQADPAADLTGVAAMDIDGEPRVSRADMGVDQTP